VRTQRFWLKTLAFAGALTCTEAAQAQTFPLGGRTAQMGGAATASGRDSAMPYLNPAGLAGLPKDLFALSANIYGVSQFRITPFFIKQFSAPTVIDEDTQRGQSVYQLPSSIMYLAKVSDPEARVRHKLAISLIIPASTKVTVSGTYRARQPSLFGAASDSRFFSYDFTDYNLGATYALAVGDRLRFGATLFGRYTASQTAEQATRSSYSFSGAIQSGKTNASATETTTRSVWGKLGLQAGLSEELWLGAGFSTPSFLHSGTSRTTSSFESRVLDVSTHQDAITEGASEDRLPWSINLGLSYERLRSFGLSVDVTHTSGLDEGARFRGVTHTYSTRTNELIRDIYQRSEGTTRYKPVTNVAIGAEVWTSSWMALRLGGFTSLNALDDPNPAVDQVYYGTANTFGITGGLGLYIGPTETSLGVTYQRSQGKILVEDNSFSPPTPNALADYSINTVLFMLAGAVSVEEARDQIKGTLPKGAQPPLPGGSTLPVDLP
jgi:hypothetical protein